MDKRSVVVGIQRTLVNPWTKLSAGLLPGSVLLETTGRRTGRPRRVPVGGKLEDRTLWIVAEHGRRAGYVRNIEANPRVRVRVRGRWHGGVARVLPGDDVRARLRWMRSANALLVRLVGTDLLSVRVDLED